MNKLLLAASVLVWASGNAAAQTLPPYVPTGGLMGWWPFSGNAGDSSGSGNHGTVNGATLTTDRFGAANKAYYFSSASCGPHVRVNMNNSATVQGALSISAWAMRVGNGCTSPRMLEWTNDTSANFNPTAGMAQWVWNNTGTTTFGSYTSTIASVNSNFTQKPNNIWTHLVYTNDGTTARFYQDGQLINTVASSGQVILGAYAAFGRMNHPSYDAFNGSLDEIGVWNRALKECEVQQLYNASSAPTVTAQYSSGTLVAVGGPFSSYQWYLNGVLIPGATSSSHTPTQNGQYTVAVGQNGCSYQSLAVSVENLAIRRLANEIGIAIWPNPATNTIVLTRTSSIAPAAVRYEVADAAGRHIAAGLWLGESVTLDVSAWSAGIYLVRCADEASGATTVMRLTKK